MYTIKVNNLELQALTAALCNYRVMTNNVGSPESVLMGRILRELEVSISKQQEEQREPVEAFERAIAAGYLSNDPQAANFVGTYMYMGLNNGKAAFKHYNTREYLKY